MDLVQKKILITGGARVGQFISDELLAAGSEVLMTYFESESEVHTKARGFYCDVANEQSVERLAASVFSQTEGVDGLVLMASIFQKDGDEVSWASFEKSFALNAFGNMLLARRFAEYAKRLEMNNAPIVSFVDWALDHPYANYDTYMAAKAGLRHYLMALQSSFAGYVRVVNIHPGLILEPDGFPERVKKSIADNTPTRSVGDAEQAAQLVALALTLDFLSDNIYLAGGQQWRHRA